MFAAQSSEAFRGRTAGEERQIDGMNGTVSTRARSPR
jgi:hypothetical protein